MLWIIGVNYFSKCCHMPLILMKNNSFVWVFEYRCGHPFQRSHWPVGRLCWATGTAQTSSWADRGYREHGQQLGRNWEGPAVSGSAASPLASVENVYTWYHSKVGGQLPAGLPGILEPREWWQQLAMFGSPSLSESCRSHSACISHMGGWYLVQRNRQKRRWRGPQQ